MCGRGSIDRPPQPQNSYRLVSDEALAVFIVRALAMAELAIAGLAIVAAAGAAAAQPVPIGEAPGREQERFREPVAPRAEPRGPVVELRSTAAPDQADAIRLTVRGVIIEGATVYPPRRSHRSIRISSAAR